jgi:predicted RNase H-like HicB family nuclease
MNLKLTTVIQEVPQSGYNAFIEEIPGINTQGATIEEAKENLLDALQLSLTFSLNKY